MDFQPSQNGMYDPSNFIDPSAIAGNQMNGTRPYPMSSIPSKRDSTGATMSRSQTPSQQPQFGGFQQGFAHTPSPTMQNQHFRPGQMPPQRMQTASPAQNPHAPQMSPMNFAQGSPMGQGFDPNAGGQFPVQSVQSIQLSQNLQHKQQETQRAYAMRMQAQQQQLGNLAASNMAAQQRHQAGQTPGAPPRQPGMPPQMMPGQMQQNPQGNPQTFLKNVHSLMVQNRRPFNPQPQVAGRPIDLFNLYSIVIKFRGSRYVSTNNAWPRIAQHLGIPVQQFPGAPEELRQAYEANLGLYEQAYMRSKAQQEQMKMNPMGQMGGQMGQMPQMGQQMSPSRNSMSGAPNAAAAAAQQEYMQQLQRKQMQQQMQQQAQRQSDAGLQQQQQQQFEQAVPQPQSTPLQSNATPALANGRSTPQADGSVAAQNRKSMSRPLEGTPAPADPTQPGGTPIKTETDVPVAQPPTEQKRHIEEEEDGIYYRPATNLTIKNTWGVLELSDELVQEVSKKLHWMPNVPELREMGVVDIRALTMSLRSGLHAETRLALDTLSKLTHENNIQLDLEQCDDLVEVLAEYAEDQLEILGTDNPEVTDIIELMSYEDVLANCQSEVNQLQDLPEFGTKAYDLDRTADRVLAITSIIRNLSFLEINHARLSSPPVVKFLSNAIRLVGTRMLFLRSYIHTLDFMKDLVTFFSNSSTRIALPSREDAYAVLHFLCAFAPSPRPTLPIRFTSYNPKIHRYLPSAVDSMAKLLAIDDPNRTYYKQIFVNEATSDPPYDLLTRAFSLAIAVVPDRMEGKPVQHHEARIADARKPYLMQGMLAADILASLAPGPESGVCRSWLEAEDGWANSLLKFAMSLCSLDARMQQPPPQPNHRGQRPMEQDREGYSLIVNRALSMIKRLGDKSRGAEPLVKRVETNGTAPADEDDEDWADDMEEVDVGGTTWKVNADILPRKETILGALLMHPLDARALRQFCGLGYLAEL